MTLLNVSVFLLLQIIIIAITEVNIRVCGNKNDVVFFNTGITSYHKPRSRNFFLDQPFIDKIVGQQTSSAVLARDQTIDQQALHSVSLKDQAVYPSGFPIFHHQPFKQNSVSVTTFKDEPLFREAALRNQESRGQQTVLRDNPLEGQSALLASEEIFEGQASTYRHQAPLKEQLFTAETSFKNLFQPFLSEQTSFQKQVEIPFISNSMKFYRDDPFIKPIDSYGRHKEIRTLSYGEPTMEYGNHALGMSSMPMISSSKHFLSLNADTSTMSPSSSFTIYGSGSPMSTVSSSIGEVHSSEAFKMKPGPELSSGSAMSTSKSNCNALVDSSPTTSNGAMTTIPSTSVNANQSSIVGHILTSLTTKPSSPIVATGIAPFVGNTLGPIHFHATKYGAILAPSFSTQNESKNNIHAYLLANTPKSSFKTEHHNFKYLIPESPKNDMKIDTQSPMLSSFNILTEEHKNGMKGIQNSFANYPLPEGLKHNWSLQQFSQPEIPSIYAPLSLNGKAKHILSSIPVAPISTISWPIETKTDVSAMLPAKSLMATDTATGNNARNLPLDMSLPLDFVASIPNGLISSIPNSISKSITGSISTSIPGGMMADMPASIPTLNLEQSLYRAEQLQQTQDARNPWYPTGLQLQLGGFGGINYTLHTSNPTTRPIELGIAKASLIPPKLPQSHAPAFAKIGVGYHL